MPRLDPHIFFGLDLGRRRDPAAIAILERSHTPTGRRDPATYEPELCLRFVLRHVEAFPLGAPYFEIVRRVRALIHENHAAASGNPIPAHWPLSLGHAFNPRKTLVVDASGVGAPIVEAFQAAKLKATLIPITITASGHPHPDPHGGYLVPRRDLISNLRILMERGLLKIPAGIHSKEALTKELINLKDHQGAHHDDLAIGLTLAAWESTRRIRSLIEEQSEVRA